MEYLSISGLGFAEVGDDGGRSDESRSRTGSSRGVSKALCSLHRIPLSMSIMFIYLSFSLISLSVYLSLFVCIFLCPSVSAQLIWHGISTITSNSWNQDELDYSNEFKNSRFLHFATAIRTVIGDFTKISKLRGTRPFRNITRRLGNEMKT